MLVPGVAAGRFVPRSDPVAMCPDRANEDGPMQDPDALSAASGRNVGAARQSPGWTLDGYANTGPIDVTYCQFFAGVRESPGVDVEVGLRSDIPPSDRVANP